MTCKESIKWLESLKNEIGQSQYQGLWHYEQALAEIIELLQSDKLIELPFIAMIEQYLVNGKFADNIYLQKFNGICATVYIDKNKWGIPLIDICGKYPYNTEEAEARLKELEK